MTTTPDNDAKRLAKALRDILPYAENDLARTIEEERKRQLVGQPAFSDIDRMRSAIARAKAILRYHP
jgi:hypothetical protein